MEQKRGMQADNAEVVRAKVATLSFEQALAELEEIVKTLESGRGSLAQAIADYERGAELRRHCEARLAEAEAKVQAVLEGADGAAAGLRDMPASQPTP